MKETILITGGKGMVGMAIKEYIFMNKNYDKYNFIFLSSKDCDLTKYEDVNKYFMKIKPKYVIHLAANVGGLYKNMNYPVEMLEDNLLINNNVLKCSHIFNVKKVISCLSTCIFPDKIEYPITEEKLHNGPPHSSNSAYAYAKRILDVQSEAYRKQYGDNFVCVIPCNIYGKYDNFSLENSHVIPGLIHKCYLSKMEKKSFIVKGSGKALRQFINSYDLAHMILYCLFNCDKKENIILSVSEREEVSIKYIAHEIAKNFNYEDNIVFDLSYSDGQYKKTVSNEKIINEIGKYNFISIKEGIKNTISWFKENYENIRR